MNIQLIAFCELFIIQSTELTLVHLGLFFALDHWLAVANYELILLPL
jgi:hypothetical protein